MIFKRLKRSELFITSWSRKFLWRCCQCWHWILCAAMLFYQVLTLKDIFVMSMTPCDKICYFKPLQQRFPTWDTRNILGSYVPQFLFYFKALRKRQSDFSDRERDLKVSIHCYSVTFIKQGEGTPSLRQRWLINLRSVTNWTIVLLYSTFSIFVNCQYYL